MAMKNFFRKGYDFMQTSYRNNVNITVVLKDEVLQVEGKVGKTLMQAVGKHINSRASEDVFGICGGNLNCGSCSAHIQEKFGRIPPADEDEVKILKTLPEYKAKTRMCCQVELTESLNGIKLNIPNSTIKEMEALAATRQVEEEIKQKPDAAGKLPKKIEVTAGEEYFWCSCGKSLNQPFCDGSHAKTPFKPFKFIPEASGTFAFCACKRTKNRPYCDKSHVKFTLGMID